MKAFITGGHGFVGTNLSRALIRKGHEVTVLSRSDKSGSPGTALAVGDPTRPGKWQESVPGHDLLINLAGASMFKMWTEQHKKRMRDSRILTTRNLVDAIPEGQGVTLLSASGVGYYGFTGDEELDENSSPGTDFLARLAADWEAEALRARDKGVRVVIMRFGVVLGRDGGALELMVKPFRFFVGGPLGSGEQWLSWIHVEDLCEAAFFAATEDRIQGPLNFAAPGPVKNRDLARSIGQVLGRPSFMPAPAFMINLVMGELGTVILKGQRAVPRGLQAEGFHFRFHDVESALRDLL
jgi:uncharacterized protein